MNNTNKMQVHAVYKVRSKRVRKTFHEGEGNTNQMTAREVILILDKVVFSEKKINSIGQYRNHKLVYIKYLASKYKANNTAKRKNEFFLQY